MSHLLDTHVLLFFLNDEERLSIPARSILADRGNVVLVSAVSLYEICLKHRLGKLRGADRFVREWRSMLQDEGFGLLDLGPEHAVAAAAFDALHRDPFDRMLAAQALVEGMVLLSADAALDGFGVRRVW